MQYTVARIEYSNSDYFQALFPEDAVDMTASLLAQPVIGMIRRWVYLVGYQPTVTCDIVKAKAAGSKLVMQLINNSTGAPERARIILLECDDYCTVSSLDTAHEVDITEGQYVDAMRKSDGTFDYFTSAATFDPANPPTGSSTLMTDINSARTPRSIP